MLQRIEKHIIIHNKDIDTLCFLSKNLYNYCNYILRQVYFNQFDKIEEFKLLIKSFKYKDKEYFEIKKYDLIKYLTKINQIDYRNLSSHTAQHVIFQLYDNWNSFFKLLKVQDKLKGKPKMPKYKDKGGKNVVVFTNQQCKLKNGYIHFPEKANLNPLKTKVIAFNQVRIVPQATCYVIEVVYKKEILNVDLDNNLYLGIDLGINNLATCIDNIGNNPFIINGRILKSINQYFNKMMAKLHSFVGNRGTSNRLKKLILKRNNKVDDYLHKTSRFIINYCIKNKIKNIIVGYNKDWKNEVNLGKVNNQKFVCIPYLKLINQLKYKGDEVGIVVIDLNEFYTSKVDSLANETIEKHEVYLGKRVKRGLFQSSTNRLINADVNGALNIMQKVIGNSSIKKIINRGNVFLPVKIKNLNSKSLQIFLEVA